jgi:maleate isomerase
MEPDFNRLAPEGVSIHVSRLKLVARSEMPALGLDHASLLKDTRVNVLAYMCAASSFMLGPSGNEQLCARLTEASGGLPSFTATGAATAALATLGAGRISVLAPHPGEIAEYLRSYLQESGFDIASFAALGLELAAINDSWPAEIYRAVRKLDHSGAEAIFVAATNFRALDAIEAIEADTGLPVVTSNQAAMWMALGMLGVSSQRAGFGRLFREGTMAPAAVR